MKMMLDTNICIYLIKRKSFALLERFRAIAEEDVSISVIVAAELAFGVAKSQRFEENKKALNTFFESLSIADLPTNAMWHYAEQRKQLEQKGKRISENDLWIAAHALATDATLITHNTHEFERVEGLRVEDWV